MSEVYELIISQLEADGYHEAAERLISDGVLHSSSNKPPRASSALSRLIRHHHSSSSSSSSHHSSHPRSRSRSKSPKPKQPQEKEMSIQPSPVEVPMIKTKPANFTTRFVTTHKGQCRVAAFSSDGTLAATGSTDTTVKLMDVVRMKTYVPQPQGQEAIGSRPVLRTLYDHSQPINALCFHPSGHWLISASKDCTIKPQSQSVMQTQAKRVAVKMIHETSNVRCIAIHPAGETILVGTDQPTLRLYDINSFACYTCSESHGAAINSVCWSNNITSKAKIFASCSKDFSVKIWDTNTGNCIKTIAGAHFGSEVCSVQFSNDGEKLLTAGKDGAIRLWDTSSGREINTFLALSSVDPLIRQQGQSVQKYRINATFNWNNDFIIGSDEATNCAIVWDSHTFVPVQRLMGHSNTVRWISASPVENVLLTCSSDSRCRFWTEDLINQPSQ